MSHRVNAGLFDQRRAGFNDDAVAGRQLPDYPFRIVKGAV
jgi:hypothetical protein